MIVLGSLLQATPVQQALDEVWQCFDDLKMYAVEEEPHEGLLPCSIVVEANLEDNYVEIQDFWRHEHKNDLILEFPANYKQRLDKGFKTWYAKGYNADGRSVLRDTVAKYLNKINAEFGKVGPEDATLWISVVFNRPTKEVFAVASMRMMTYVPFAMVSKDYKP